MREIRTSGSEGGDRHQSVLPTPIPRQIQLVTGTAALPDHTEEDPTPQTEAICSEPFETRRTCPCCGEGILVLVGSIQRPRRAPP